MPERSPLTILNEARKSARLANDPASRYCTLATIEQQKIDNGKPQVRTRTLVVRDITDTACLLYVNRDGQKNLAYNSNANVELLLFYPSSMMQFRLRGKVALMDEGELKEHWQRKPYEAKLLDHYYASYQPQSSKLQSRDDLENGIAELKRKYPEPDNVPFSDNALGIYVHADYVEVWKVEESGLHERKLYLRNTGPDNQQQWQSTELVP